MEKKLVSVARAILDIEPIEKSRALTAAAGTMKFAANEGLIGPSPKVHEALIGLIREWQPGRQDGNKERKLKAKLSEYVSLPQDAISCFENSRRALDYICRTYLEPGTEALICGAAENNLEIIASSLGAEVTQAHFETPFEPSIETLINLIRPRTKAIFIDNPDGISGGMFTEAELVFLLAYAERTMVVVNEEYFEFSGCSVSDLVPRFPNLIVLRSFSRGFCLSELGLAYILSDPENLEFINRSSRDDSPSMVLLTAALAALDDMAFTKSYTALIEESKKILADSLPEIGYEFQIAPANFLLLKVSNVDLAMELLNTENIATKDLTAFDMPGLIRITLGNIRYADQLLMALSRNAEKIATGFNRNRGENSTNRLATHNREMAGKR